MALVYGATGSTNLDQIADYLARNVLLHNGLLLAGIALLLVGFGFKIAAVPFHLWTPDVYQGSPSPVTGFMAAVAKTGGFAALLRVFVSSFPTVRSDWQPIVWVLAVITLLFGAAVGIVQRDVKRMLAYSSINHAGFVLLGLYLVTVRGVSGSLYYLFTYYVHGDRELRGHHRDGRAGRQRAQPRQLPGARQTPTLACCADDHPPSRPGRPPRDDGLWAKIYVIEGVVGTPGGDALAVIAMVSAVVAAFFYLRLVLYMVSSPHGAELAGTGDFRSARRADRRRPGSRRPPTGSVAAPQAALWLPPSRRHPPKRQVSAMPSACPPVDRYRHSHMRRFHGAVRGVALTDHQLRSRRDPHTALISSELVRADVPDVGADELAPVVDLGRPVRAPAADLVEASGPGVGVERPEASRSSYPASSSRRSRACMSATPFPAPHASGAR